MDDRILAIYENLYARFGDLDWWPAKTPYEVIVGAVLTQNTAWSNVEKSIANWGDNLSPLLVLDAKVTELAEIIRPAGFFNQKAMYLKTVTAWFAKYNFDVQTVRREPLEKVRRELLALKGIGNETADSILLYAFGFPTFVVDAYTMRLVERLPLQVGTRNYNSTKAFFEKNLPQDAKLFNEYHALIVLHAKAHCQKKPKYP